MSSNELKYLSWLSKKLIGAIAINLYVIDNH